MIDDTAVVTTFRYCNNESRLKNLRIFKEHYKKYYNHFVIVEQDKVSAAIPEVQSDNDIKYIFAYNAGEFNRSWGLNIGAMQFIDDVKIRNILFCDIDVILNDNAIYESEISIKTDGFVNPYSYIKHLNEDSTKFFEEKKFTINIGGGVTTPSFAGGALLMSKEVFKEVNGWDEVYRGWGGEDNALAYLLLRRYKTFTTIKNGKAVHLFHNSDFPNQIKKNHSYYKSNLDRARWITKIGVNSYMRIKRKEKIGNIERYL